MTVNANNLHVSMITDVLLIYYRTSQFQVGHACMFRHYIKRRLLHCMGTLISRNKEAHRSDFPSLSNLHPLLVRGPQCGQRSCLPVIVCDAVDLVVYIDGEGYPIQAVIAHTASEAAGVVGLPHGL